MDHFIAADHPLIFDFEEIPSSINTVNLSERVKSQLAKGEWSELLEGLQFIDGTIHDAKIKLTRDSQKKIKVNFHIKKENLVIPDKISGYVLSEEDKSKLKNNEYIGPLKYKENDLYVKVDPELNDICVKSANDIKIPSVIGKNNSIDFDGSKGFSGYILCEADKILLANGGTLSPKLFAGDDGYFMASFRITEDKKALVFGNVTSVSFDKAKEIYNKLNLPKETNLTSTVVDSANTFIVPKNSLINEVIAVGSDQILVDTKSTEKIPPKEPIATPEGKEKEKKDNHPQPNTQTTDSTKDVSTSSDQKTAALDNEFYLACQSRDFVTLENLNQQGYKPSEKVIEHVGKMSNLTDKESTVIRAIFQIEPERILSTTEKKSSDLKIEKSQEQSKEKKQSTTETISQTATKLFNDM